MTLHTSILGVVGDDTGDLFDWLRRLPDCPPVTHTVLAACDQHGDESPSWCYVEADPRTGVARRRCVACGETRSVADSEQRWTFPPMFSCPTCAQSLVEIAAGLSAPDGEDGTVADWMVLAARCVDCGRIEGLTDLVLPRLPIEDAVRLL